MNPYHLNERQKVELRDILNRKAASICRKVGISLRLTGQIRPDEDYVEFWCRTGRAQPAEYKGQPHASFAGLLQFTLYGASPESHERLEKLAHRIADDFSERRWCTDDCFVTTDLMGVVWLPPSDTRDRVGVVDGGFHYTVALTEACS
jgi:hypothetical protein